MIYSKVWLLQRERSLALTSRQRATHLRDNQGTSTGCAGPKVQRTPARKCIFAHSICIRSYHCRILQSRVITNGNPNQSNSHSTNSHSVNESIIRVSFIKSLNKNTCIYYRQLILFQRFFRMTNNAFLSFSFYNICWRLCFHPEQF